VAKDIKDFEASHGKLAERERTKFAERITDLTMRLKRAESELQAAEDIRHAVFGLAEHDLAPPKWIAGGKKPKEKLSLSVPVLLVSDEQVGEKIVSEEIEGINVYNHEIYVQRHDVMMQKVVEISTHHMQGLQFPMAVVAFLGDAISGEIHAELAETNSLQSVPSTALVVETRRNAINFLLKHFERLMVIVIPGNHGRTTMKPRFKKYASMNYEALIGWWLQSLFANEPRVKIVVPPSGDYHMMLWGRGLFFTHGDRLGGMSGKGAGMGFAGAALPIIRGSRNVREQQTAIGRKIDYIHIGHWHDRMEVAGTWANGTMAGYNEYAHGLRYRAAPAEQWLYYLHPEHGATARWPIFLSAQPRAVQYDDTAGWMA